MTMLGQFNVIDLLSRFDKENELVDRVNMMTFLNDRLSYKLFSIHSIQCQ
jgi:hypothetical protein